ncbi:YqeG family HAD IIIA-type phosphatase [Collinsella provencensis]|uniref:YqeG family HAD IIIA-type phosphatase n=1 Tax=Collinsella provencensis TaxID=1937461 RepID=UPI000C85C924|nr:YqeG family HAD IIIA-type phosphatase [Collinsella provencensis]
MSKFSPTRYISCVEHIDLDALWAQGKRALLFDRDNTLVPRDRTTAPDAVCAWMDHARELGFKLIMVSNNWHKNHVARSARELGMDYIFFACKPLPFAINYGLERLGAKADESVMIGDQLYTDVWAGNFAGVETILVKPQTHVDMWYTHIFRIFERRALAHLECEE